MEGLKNRSCKGRMGEGEAIVLQKSLGSLRSLFRQQSFVSRGAEGGFCAASERRDRSLGGCLKVDMNTGKVRPRAGQL